MSFVAITRVIYSPEVKSTVLEIAAESAPIARRQPGLIGCRFHGAKDDSHTMMYWEWETQADHDACMASSDWDGLNERWSQLFASDDARFEMDTYELVDAWGAD